METAYLALGTNLGDKIQNLNKAVEEIGKRIGTVISLSAYYASEPWGFDSVNNFVNAVVGVDTKLDAKELLAQTQEIELDLGRQEKSKAEQYTDRIIDIDILILGKQIIDSPELKIPHPHILDRDFVYIPLLEIAPSILIPNTQSPLKSLIQTDLHTLQKLK